MLLTSHISFVERAFATMDPPSSVKLHAARFKWVSDSQ